ncbi:hypothetical protein OSTOST_25609, partial [Ostertagia ostertagi]
MQRSRKVPKTCSTVRLDEPYLKIVFAVAERARGIFWVVEIHSILEVGSYDGVYVFDLVVERKLTMTSRDTDPWKHGTPIDYAPSSIFGTWTEYRSFSSAQFSAQT